MAHAPPAPVPINDVRLPLDLNEIGLDFELTSANAAELDADAILTHVPSLPDADNRLYASFVSTKTVFAKDSAARESYCMVDGVRYNVVAHAGNGSYGATCVVEDPTGRRFVLKEQISETGRDKDFIKEAIINFVIHKATSPLPLPPSPMAPSLPGSPAGSLGGLSENSAGGVASPLPASPVAVAYKPFAGQVYKIFYSKRQGFQKIYCMIDLLAIDAKKYLAASIMDDGNIFSRSDAIYNIFNQYIYRLKQLYDMYRYTHGDFKPDNVMFDHDDNLRLIDFGFSKITLKDAADIPITLVTNADFNSSDNESQDNTNMATFIRILFPLTTAAFALSSYLFIRTIVYGYGCNLSACINVGGVRCNIPNAAGGINRYQLTDIGNLYTLLDRFENPAGKFDVVTAALEAIPLPQDTINPSHRGLARTVLYAPPPPVALAAPAAGASPFIGGAKLKQRNKTRRYNKTHDTSGKRKVTRRNVAR